MLQIDRRSPWREHIGVAGRKTARPQAIELIALLFAPGLTQGFRQPITPGLGKLDNLFPDLLRGQLAVLDLGYPNGELDPRKDRLGKVGDKLDVFRSQPVNQHLLDFQP